MCIRTPLFDIYFIKGATAWEWQVGRVYGGIRYPRFWRTSGLAYVKRELRQ